MDKVQLELEPMNATSLKEFRSALKTRYTLDRQNSNLLTEAEAIEFTKTQWASILPEGTATEGHHFLPKQVQSGDAFLGGTWAYVDQTNQSALLDFGTSAHNLTRHAVCHSLLAYTLAFTMTSGSFP